MLEDDVRRVKRMLLEVDLSVYRKKVLDKIVECFSHLKPFIVPVKEDGVVLHYFVRTWVDRRIYVYGTRFIVGEVLGKEFFDVVRKHGAVLSRYVRPLVRRAFYDLCMLAGRIRLVEEASAEKVLSRGFPDRGLKYVSVSSKQLPVIRLDSVDSVMLNASDPGTFYVLSNDVVYVFNIGLCYDLRDVVARFPLLFDVIAELAEQLRRQLSPVFEENGRVLEQMELTVEPYRVSRELF
ncbi:MAG: hypothetical protein QXZ08_00685 [Nitrososphaeria archaeon]